MAWRRSVLALMAAAAVTTRASVATGAGAPTEEECAAAAATVGTPEAAEIAIGDLQEQAVTLRAIQSERFAGAVELVSMHRRRRNCTEAACRAAVAGELEARYATVRGLRDRMLAVGRSALAAQRGVASAVATLEMCRARDAACVDAADAAGCRAGWVPPPAGSRCDIDAFDRLADTEVAGAAAAEAGAAEVLGAMESTGTLDEEECGDVDAFIAAVEGAAARVQCHGQWAMHTARRLLRNATRILPPYNFVMTQCGPRVTAGLAAAAAAAREVECDRQRDLLAQYRAETSAQMARVNAIGRVVLQHQRNLAAGLQARQRCAVPRPSLEEEVEVQDEVGATCGPLAAISLGSIMDTIDAAVPSAPPSALDGIGDSLENAVQQFSAKLFCAVEDLKGRIPLANAIELLRLYNQHMDCGRDYISNYGVCRDLRRADMIDPEVSRSEAIAAGKACVAAAKETRRECRAALAPVMQRTRHEIRSAMTLIHEDASIVMRWTEAQSRLLETQYDAVRGRLQAIADRYARLGEIRSRIRSDMFEDDDL